MAEIPSRFDKKLPRQIDALKFAFQGLQLEGYALQADMARLQPLLVAGDQANSQEATVEADLAFSLDEHKNRVAEGKFAACLPLLCQRCLQVVNIPIEQEIHWGFVWDDEAARQLPRNLDPVLLDPDTQSIDLWAALEEDLLLAVPLTVLHETCADGDSGEGKVFGDKPEVEAAPEENPFSVLKGLKLPQGD